jgi:hypothetical protein
MSSLPNSLNSSGNLERSEKEESNYFGSNGRQDKGSVSPRSARAQFNINVGSRSLHSYASHDVKEKDKGDKQPMSPRGSHTPRERERERATNHTPRDKSLSPTHHHRSSSPPSSLPSSPRGNEKVDRSRAGTHQILLPISLSRSREVSPRPLSTSSALSGHHNIKREELQAQLQLQALLQSQSNNNTNNNNNSDSALPNAPPSVSSPSTPPSNSTNHHPVGLFLSLANHATSSPNAPSNAHPSSPSSQQGFAINPNQTVPLSPRSKSFASQTIRHDTTDS